MQPAGNLWKMLRYTCLRITPANGQGTPTSTTPWPRVALGKVLPGTTVQGMRASGFPQPCPRGRNRCHKGTVTATKVVSAEHLLWATVGDAPSRREHQDDGRTPRAVRASRYIELPSEAREVSSRGRRTCQGCADGVPSSARSLG